MTVAQVVSLVESLAPPSLAFEWDRTGLQVGDPSADARRVLVCLDCTLGAIERAREIDSGLIVAHHPVIWEPLRQIGPGVVWELARSGTALYAAHTSWDCADGGVNDALASCLGLQDVQTFGPGAVQKAHKLVVFVPAPAAAGVINAMSAVGAGVIGTYSRCAFSGPGTGTFIPGEGSHPAIGAHGKLEEVCELRVEMVVAPGLEEQAEEALREAHPYEEPAFDWIPLRPKTETPLGRLGKLESPLDAAALGGLVASRLSTRVEVWDASRPIERVAVIGGAGSSEWKSALAAGADALVTGEAKQSDAVAASSAGLTLIAAGHYATEQPGMKALCESLTGLGVDCELYTPPPGSWGRPLTD